MCYTQIPHFNMKAAAARRAKSTAQITNGRYFPNGLKDRSRENPPKLSPPKPLPAVGFFRVGFSFGSSWASPTGSASASSFGKIVIENIKIPRSESPLFGCLKEMNVFGTSIEPSFYSFVIDLFRLIVDSPIASSVNTPPSWIANFILGQSHGISRSNLNLQLN